MASDDRVLTVRMPESLYDSFIELAWGKRMTAGLAHPLFVAEAVRQTQDHKDTATIHPLFEDRSAEEGWYLIARILADELSKLDILHSRVIAVIRNQGSAA